MRRSGGLYSFDRDPDARQGRPPLAPADKCQVYGWFRHAIWLGRAVLAVYATSFPLSKTIDDAKGSVTLSSMLSCFLWGATHGVEVATSGVVKVAGRVTRARRPHWEAGSLRAA